MRVFLCAKTSERFGAVSALPVTWTGGSVARREQVGFICLTVSEQPVWVTANAPRSGMVGLPGGNAAKRSKSFKLKKKKKRVGKCRRRLWVLFIVSLHLFICLSDGGGVLLGDPAVKQ